MAKATRNDPKPVKQPPLTYTLELSEGEADFILAVTSAIGGHPENSPRKYAQRIESALEEVLEIGSLRTDAHKLISSRGRVGAIYFKNYDGTDWPQSCISSAL